MRIAKRKALIGTAVILAAMCLAICAIRLGVDVIATDKPELLAKKK